MTTTRTLPADHTPSVRAVTDRDKALADVFTTALEGGIGYWSTCSRYLWSTDGTLDGQARDFIAVIHDSHRRGRPATTSSTARSIVRGLRLAHARGNWATYHARALADLTFGKYDDMRLRRRHGRPRRAVRAVRGAALQLARGGLRAWGSGALQALAGVHTTRGLSSNLPRPTFTQELPASASHDSPTERVM